MGAVDIQLRRSGFVEWGYEYANDFVALLILVPLTFLGNVLTHLLVFRCGWTLHVSAGDYYYKKVRYRSKGAAEADMERQREVAAAVPPPPPGEPVKLPTRGGSLRRPW